MVSFAVQDSGVGIPEEYQASVFGRFESRSQGSKHRGAGLGLAIVKSLVELHGGQIKLRSAPGVGTTVTVTHPAKSGPPHGRACAFGGRRVKRRMRPRGQFYSQCHRHTL